MQLRIRGLAELQRKVETQDLNLKPEMEKATRDAINYVHSQVPPYPPVRLETYNIKSRRKNYRKRTDFLGGSITTDVRSMGNEVAGVIGTAAEYAPWVISSQELPDGRGPQAWMHQDRWWTLQGVVEGCRDKIVGFYRKMVQKLLSQK